MKVFNIIAIFIYTLLFSIIGAVLIALSLRVESLELAIKLIGQLSSADNLRLGMAVGGLLLILVNISIAQLSIGNMQKHKTIAFENPYGEVTVALSAIEDYIKKLTNRMSEIKEIKSNISAGKSGIEVIVKTTPYSDVNIPEVTEKIQNAIRLHLQEILGIEETVTIKVHVAKIAQREKRIVQEEAIKESGQSGFKGEIEYGR
ncbi:alkaline shock response membrane anchor protein AmaP [Candidatus Omnitrophota bacterium]